MSKIVNFYNKPKVKKPVSILDKLEIQRKYINNLSRIIDELNKDIVTLKAENSRLRWREKYDKPR